MLTIAGSVDLQAALNETDPAYVSKRMLQKLHSTEGRRFCKVHTNILNSIYFAMMCAQVSSALSP